MKYILVEIPNEVSEDELENAAMRVRTVVDFDDVTVRFGSLFTSL